MPERTLQCSCLLNRWKSNSFRFAPVFDVLNLSSRIASLEAQFASTQTWTERTKILELCTLRGKLEKIQLINRLYDDIVTLLELANEDPNLLCEAESEAFKLNKILDETLTELLLRNTYDSANAIIAIHAGQGGTEACDFAAMLFRMYQKWSEKKKFRFRELDFTSGEGTGCKSATIAISGNYAFGLLKSEAGVHRIKRVSPFGDGSRRHTSFASIDVWPEIKEAAALEISPDDLKIEAYRSGGPGGQNVNKVSSAIRITHLPTKTVVQCQSERSQLMNKETALAVLKSRLLAIRQKEVDEQRNALRSKKKQITWGSQIRSYTFSPYTQVKDHRTKVETVDIEKILNGELDEFTRAWLLWHAENEDQDA